ncbi:Arm DNA-binding domain-containing protein [Ilumatobacter sp.]|uniref:Arm DNA-binding domain-containing protein n=1 Tax=Ilumatobacter sp. TaxID=1967498 RepID=UPI00374FEE1C
MANGSVYRRDDRKKPWIAHISWHEGDRRRQSKKSYATKREAQEALAEAIDSHRRQEFVAPTAVRLRDFFVTWIDSLETQGRKVSTIEGYRKTMSSYVLPTLGSYRLQDLRPTDLDDLYAALLRSGGVGGRPLSMTTVHHVHTQLGKLLDDAERKGLVMRNVASLADAPSLAAARDRAPDMNVWTPDELRRFLEFSEDYRAGPMLHPAAMTGMRRLKLLTAKLVALTGFTVIACTVTVLTTAAVARPLARIYDVETAAWRTDAPVELLSGAFNFLVPTLVWGLIGLTIAVLTRSAGVAIGLGIGWLLVVENLIAITAPDLTDYLPGGTLSALAGGGTPDLEWSLALGLTTLYGIAATTISFVTFRTATSPAEGTSRAASKGNTVVLGRGPNLTRWARVRVAGVR